MTPGQTGWVGWVGGLDWDSRVLVTTSITFLFLAATSAVYAVGPYLKGHRLSEDAVEALQSVVVTGLGIVVAGLVVVVWRLQTDVGTALGVVTFDGQSAALVIVSLVVFGVAYTVTRITKRLVKRQSRRDAITDHQRELAHHVVQVLVFVPTMLFVLALWGVNPGDLLLGAGAIGVIVGLAAKQTLGSVIAGFVLLFARPFQIGDWVVVDDEEGIVTDVTVFNTEILTFDNEHVLVPNDEVTSTDIVNRSRNDLLRLGVEVGVAYDADPREAADVAERAMQECETVLEEPPPGVAMTEFGSSSVGLDCRFWIDDPSIARKWEAQNEVVEAVKTEFDREGIEIPFPQRVVSTRGGSASPSPPGREAATANGGDAAEEENRSREGSRQ